MLLNDITKQSNKLRATTLGINKQKQEKKAKNSSLNGDTCKGDVTAREVVLLTACASDGKQIAQRRSGPSFHFGLAAAYLGLHQFSAASPTSFVLSVFLSFYLSSFYIYIYIFKYTSKSYSALFYVARISRASYAS